MKLFRHKKTGGIYEIIAEGHIEATLEKAVVYKSQSDGEIWIRPKAEFFDGRFEKY